MGRIVVHIFGKPKDKNLAAIITDYSNRISSRGMTVKLYSDKKSPDNYEKKLTNLNGDLIILDENGTQKTSKELSELVLQVSLSDETVNFAIGPPDGFSDKLKNKVVKKISLSKMTFLHEMAASILLEQLYRATEIIRGSPYHRK
jgi:23S rRNA (pseudouridine1915-N3)-methyltransferase